MTEEFEKKREKMWEDVLSMTEEYTGELLSNEDMSDEDLSLNLSSGFDVLSGVLSEWIAAINLDVMDLNKEEHAAFVESMLAVVKDDMLESYDELAMEDDLETVYKRANKIVNADDKDKS